MPQTRIGISGWRYEPWRGKFYPNDLPQKSELHYASRQLSSIEINGTFYSLMRPSSFQTWYDETPDDFVFSVKCPRFITHIRRLKDIDEAQMILVSTAKDLAARGEIVIASGKGEDELIY